MVQVEAADVQVAGERQLAVEGQVQGGVDLVSRGFSTRAAGCRGCGPARTARPARRWPSQRPCPFTGGFTWPVARPQRLARAAVAALEGDDQRPGRAGRRRLAGAVMVP